MNLTTLVKIATSYEELEEIIKKAGIKMIPKESIRGNTKQYWLFEKNPFYMLGISQHIKKELTTIT